MSLCQHYGMSLSDCLIPYWLAFACRNVDGSRTPIGNRCWQCTPTCLAKEPVKLDLCQEAL